MATTQVGDRFCPQWAFLHLNFDVLWAGAGGGDMIFSNSIRSITQPITRRSDEHKSSKVLVTYSIVFGVERIVYKNKSKEMLDFGMIAQSGVTFRLLGGLWCGG